MSSQGEGPERGMAAEINNGHIMAEGVAVSEVCFIGSGRWT